MASAIPASQAAQFDIGSALRRPYQFAIEQKNRIQTGNLTAKNPVLRVAEVALRAIACFVAFVVGFPLHLLAGPESASSNQTRIKPAAQRPLALSAEQLQACRYRTYDDDADVIARMDRALVRARSKENSGADRPTPTLTARMEEHASEDLSADFSAQGLEVGLAGLQGRRPTMEDDHLAKVISVRINGQQIDVPVFGVFDGHGGSECSAFVAANYEQALKEKLENYCAAGFTPAGIMNALKLTMVELDDRYRQEHPGVHDGTTATVALILDGHLYTANTGDSRIVLQNGDTTMQLTEDAEPSNPKYESGIQKRGGVVLMNRVNGSLGVARAIGDQDFPSVTPRPKVTRIPLAEIQRGDATLVLSCDGLYERNALTSSEVARAAKAQRGDMTAAEMATGLADKAIERGSTDNVSAMVIRF